MNIKERLDAKRKEYESVNAEQERLYVAVTIAEAARDAALTPWSVAYNKANQIQKEIAALEIIANELGVA